MDAEKNYTANIQVVRVTRQPVTGTNSGGKRSTESFRLAVRSPTLDGLREKLDKHLALIDDEDFGDD